jgi:hypothetical protein
VCVCCDAHTHELLQCAIPFSVCCLLARFGGGGRGTRVPAAPLPAQPACQQHTPMYSRLFVVVSHIYIYIYICSTSHTDRHRSISVCLYSLSLYIVLVLVACTLSHHHHHHTTRAVRVYACVCVCAFGSLSSNASDVPITGHI